MNLYKLHNNPETLYGYEQRYEIPGFAYDIAVNRDGRSPELEPYIMKNSLRWSLYKKIKR
jgi:hypothetical protein